MKNKVLVGFMVSAMAVSTAVGTTAVPVLAEEVQAAGETLDEGETLEEGESLNDNVEDTEDTNNEAEESGDSDAKDAEETPKEEDTSSKEETPEETTDPYEQQGYYGSITAGNWCGTEEEEMKDALQYDVEDFWPEEKDGEINVGISAYVKENTIYVFGYNAKLKTEQIDYTQREQKVPLIVYARQHAKGLEWTSWEKLSEQYYTGTATAGYAEIDYGEGGSYEIVAPYLDFNVTLNYPGLEQMNEKFTYDPNLEIVEEVEEEEDVVIEETEEVEAEEEEFTGGEITNETASAPKFVAVTTETVKSSKVETKVETAEETEDAAEPEEEVKEETTPEVVEIADEAVPEAAAPVAAAQETPAKRFPKGPVAIVIIIVAAVLAMFAEFRKKKKMDI